MKNKIHLWLLLPLGLSALASCSSSTTYADGSGEKEEAALKGFLLKARESFSMKGDKVQNVTDLSGNPLFKNTYDYDYLFVGGNRGKVYQTYGYYSGGQKQTSTMSFARSEDGYIAREYINYKNEIGYSKVADTDGYYAFYDQYFTNPFEIVDVDDFSSSSSEGKTTYSLVKSKINMFDYFLTGNSEPLSSLALVSDGSSWYVNTVSSTFIGRTKQENSEYARCTWTYQGNYVLSKIGETVIEGPSASKKKENVALQSAFSSINDNFTLTCVLALSSDLSTPLQTKVSYFDGSSYYIDLDSTKDDKASDYLYHVDPFSPEDSRLYEYRYNDASKLWVKSSNDSESSYNVDPMGKELFAPHLKEMSVDLFAEGMDKDDYFVVTNDYALAYIGEGFFSDGELLPYFSYGYGIDGKVKLNDDGGLTAVLSFYMPISNSYIPVTYTITYSNIGSTSIPEVDL